MEVGREFFACFRSTPLIPPISPVPLQCSNVLEFDQRVPGADLIQQHPVTE